MCGFVGALSFDQTKTDIRDSLSVLGRRGPDGHKEWSSPDNFLKLLHTRLAIVDQRHVSDQPMVDAKNGLVLCFVGEIYNYQELKSKYSNYEYATEADSEVILAVYASQGSSGFSDLKGMFVLALADLNSKQIYLYRDPVGKKPLYIANWKHAIYFGTNALSFVAINKKHEGFNFESDQWWTDGYADPASSVFQNVTPVLPGQLIQINWKGDINKADNLCVSPSRLYKNETLQESMFYVREMIRESILDRLNNSGQPVFLLSGGVDSTVLCLLLKEIDPDLQHAIKPRFLSLGSYIPLTQDELYARYAAKRMGIQLEIQRIKIRNLAQEVSNALDLQDEPLGMISFFMLCKLVEYSRSVGKVLITGDGGDETFFGYGSSEDWIQTHGRWNEECRVYPGRFIPDWISQWGADTTGRSLVGHHFTKVDRASAEQGVEIRCPYLSHDLICYVRSLPKSYLFHEDTTKYLLKKQLNDWPSWFVHRKKLGFAYNLRWQWALSGFSGLREEIDSQSIHTFSSQLPVPLRGNPAQWKTKDIFTSFTSVWKLLAWSRFLRKIRHLTPHS